MVRKPWEGPQAGVFLSFDQVVEHLQLLAWMPMQKKKPNKQPIRIMILAL